MSTIDSKEIIVKMLKNDGTYPGDPQMFSIWQYKNQWDNITFSICQHERAEMSLLQSEFVREAKLLWAQNQGLTELGKELTKNE